METVAIGDAENTSMTISLNDTTAVADELAIALRLIQSGDFQQGKLVERLEREFAASLPVQHAIAVSSGTAAVHLALLAHGVGPGSDVIMPPFACSATAHAVLLCGARPVFVDIDDRTMTLDPSLISASLTPDTKVILPVHLFGHPANMPDIMRVAEHYGLRVIEDATQAHTAAIKGRPVGTFTTGCFSLSPTAESATGTSGMITTNDAGVASRLRLLRDHGHAPNPDQAVDVDYRLTDLQAGLGLAHFSQVDERARRRIRHAWYLSSMLAGVRKPTVVAGYRHVFQHYAIRVQSGRDVVARRLREAGIDSGVYYPRPIHHQSLYASLGYRDRCPIAERVCSEVLSLPVHPALTPAELAVVGERVSSIVARLAPRTAALAPSWDGVQ